MPQSSHVTQNGIQFRQGGSRTTSLACFRELHTFAIIVIFNRFENTSKYVDTLTLSSKNLNQRSLTPRWPLTPCLLRSHVWLYPRDHCVQVPWRYINGMWIQWSILQITTYIHTHTTYILRTYRIVSNKAPGGVAIFQKGDVYKRQVFNAKMQWLS